MTGTPRITLYSTGSCPHCRQARQYLQQKGVRFQELDVQRNPRAQKAFARLGARGVPVIMVGETRIDGFDRKRLDAALKR
ncbi:MAG: glutathione S-transferase N-terminal domain-containing protein [Gammaproteobacteria bacterium]|nr:glutathione S-transferase N-terminal domain-containing protein [Gammaproteobacteria bacterium]